tara:strand:- start:435 stop:641 length:207 start_codon:yes stop_codon:yes gene_type:complete
MVVGEEVRANFYFINKKGWNSCGYRRATIISVPENWMKDAGAQITVKDANGLIQETSFGDIYKEERVS